jgi:hypothetical protein
VLAKRAQAISPALVPWSASSRLFHHLLEQELCPRATSMLMIHEYWREMKSRSTQVVAGTCSGLNIGGTLTAEIL